MEEVINPFLSLRKQAGFTLGDLASQTGINIKALSRSEYGMYTNPLPGLVDYWVRRGLISEGVLVTEYEDYKYAIRRHNHHPFGTELTFNVTSNIHPLRQLRAEHSYGLVEFCKALCLPLDTIQFFEKKWRTQQSVPKGLLLALNQCGYSQYQLRGFQVAYTKWRNSQARITFS